MGLRINGHERTDNERHSDEAGLLRATCTCTWKGPWRWKLALNAHELFLSEDFNQHLKGVVGR